MAFKPFKRIHFGPDLELFSEDTRFSEDEIEEPLNRKLLLPTFLELRSDKFLGSPPHFDSKNPRTGLKHLTSLFDPLGKTSQRFAAEAPNKPEVKLCPFPLKSIVSLLLGGSSHES